MPQHALVLFLVINRNAEPVRLFSDKIRDLREYLRLERALFRGYHPVAPLREEAADRSAVLPGRRHLQLVAVSVDAFAAAYREHFRRKTAYPSERFAHEALLCTKLRLI